MPVPLRQRNPGAPLGRLLFFEFAAKAVEAALTLLYRLRVSGRDRIPGPGAGALVVVANHQSHLDPPAVGVALHRARHIVPIARASLFRNPAFGTLLRGLNSISIKDEGSDAAAIRAAIEGLKGGRTVLIFPEGTRTGDGELHGFKRGVWILLSRAKSPVLPVAVEGCYDAWPRGRRLPSVFGKRIAVAIGDPIPHSTLAAMGPDAGLMHLLRTIDALRLGLRRQLRESSGGAYPAAGSADGPAPEVPSPAD